MKDMNAKLKHLICLSILTLVALQGLSATRLTASNLRRKSTQDKASGEVVRSSRSSSTVKSTQVEVETSNLGDDASKSTGRNSLLPEGFDSAGADSGKPSAVAQKVLSAEGLAVKGDLKIEFGEGHGETADEALKEAMKDVLQKVVGVYVDSDFRINNDEIIKDEIITHSNGFIDHYKKMDEETDKDGRGKVVTIKAWVKMRDFVNRMKKIAPSQTMRMDGMILDNDLSNKLNAETLLKKEFENLNPALDLLDVKLVDNIRPVVRESTDDTVTLRYVFQIRYSKIKYYKEFIPRITRVLDQIAEATPRNRNLSLDVKKVKLMPANTVRNGNNNDVWRERPVPGFLVRMPRNYRKGEKCIDVITVVNGKSATVREWRLSERLIDVYKACHGKSFKECKSVSCSLSLSDTEGNILSQASAELFDDWYVPYRFATYPEKNAPEEIDFAPFMGAWVGCFSSYELNEQHPAGFGDAWYDSYVGCVDITVNRQDVAKIKTAKVSLETENQGGNE